VKQVNLYPVSCSQPMAAHSHLSTRPPVPSFRRPLPSPNLSKLNAPSDAIQGSCSTAVHLGDQFLARMESIRAEAGRRPADAWPWLRGRELVSACQAALLVLQRASKPTSSRVVVAAAADLARPCRPGDGVPAATANSQKVPASSWFCFDR
jgi:hypothetical protein